MEASANPLAGVLPVRLDAVALSCATHGTYAAKGTRMRTGEEKRDPCPQCQAAEQLAAKAVERAQLEARRLAQLEQQLGASGIPPRFAGKGFGDYRAETPNQQRALGACKGFVDDFEEARRRGLVLILSGKPGTGKTHLAASMLRALMPAHPGLYTTTMGLIRAVRDTWRRDSARSESDVLAEFGRAPLLVLDEVGMQYGTDGEQTILFDVLDRRYREMRPSVLITNATPDELGKVLGDRLADRLRETARLVVFDWPSYRPQARKEAA